MSTEESATATEDIPASSEDKDTLELEPLISVLSGAQKDMLILRAIQRDRSLVDTLIEFALDPLTHERALMRASELEPSAIASSVRSYALAGSRLNAIMLLRATTERVLAALTELDETIRDVGLQKFLEEEAKPELEAVEENPAVGTLGALWLELLKAELPPPESAAEVAELLEKLLAEARFAIRRSLQTSAFRVRKVIPALLIGPNGEGAAKLAEANAFAKGIATVAGAAESRPAKKAKM